MDKINEANDLLDNSLSQNVSYKQYGYRWVNTGIVLLTSIVGSMMVQTCTPIVEELSEAYEISTTFIKMTALIFMFTHPFLTILANFIVDTYGLKAGMNLGSLLVILGLGIRTFCNFNFRLVLVGAIFCSAGNVYVLNTPTKIAANWWFPKNRVAVTTALTFSNAVSGAIGTFMSVLLFDKNNPKGSFERLMYIQLILIGGIFVLNILLFRAQPPTPPSFSSSQPRESFKEGMPHLIKNKQYLKLFLIVMIIIGSLQGFMVNTESSVKPFGFHSEDIVYTTSCSTILSIIGSVISILIMKRYRKFKLIIGILIFFGALSISTLSLTLYLENLWLLILFSGLCGFSLYPIIPNCVELGCELVYPISEATSTGTLMAGGQIASFFLGIITSEYVVDGKQKWRSLMNGLIVSGLLLIALVLTISLKVELKREKQDQEHANYEGESPDQPKIDLDE